MKCLTSSAFVALTALAGLGAMVETASADTLRQFSPLLCRMTSGLTTPINSVMGNITNTSYSYSKTVICPIERYNLGAAPLGVYVNVVDNSTHSTAGAVSCLVTRVNQLGTASANGTAAASTSAGTGSGMLAMTSIPAFVTNGEYVLRCTLPKRLKTTTHLDPASTMNNYFVVEPDIVVP